MGTVATLAVNVIANTGGLTKGFSKAKKESKSFGASFGASMKSFVTPAALATAGIAAVGVAVYKIGSQLSRLDEIAKKARGLGISGQDLMGFQHAAGLAGVQAESFTRAMMDMQKNIGDAMAGTGEAKDALALIGVEIGDLARLGASEQFLAIADKISKIGNASERAAVATRIFGGAGADLIPMLIQGSAAIREQTEELKRLQGVITDMEFQGIEGANDAMDKVGKSIEGIWMNIAVVAAPTIEAIANIITSVIAEFKSWNNELDGTLKYFAGIYGIILAIHDTVDWATGGSLTNTSNEAAAAARAAEETQKKLKITMAEETALRDKQIKKAQELATAREKLEAKGASLMESLRTPMEMYTDTIANLNMMLGEGVIEWETYSRAVEKAQDNIRDLEEFEKKEIKVAERQAVGAAIRGQVGTFSIQQQQQRTLEKLREEERLQTRQLKAQTESLRQINNKLSVGVVVGI